MTFEYTEEMHELFLNILPYMKPDHSGLIDNAPQKIIDMRNKLLELGEIQIQKEIKLQTNTFVTSNFNQHTTDKQDEGNDPRDN